MTVQRLLPLEGGVGDTRWKGHEEILCHDQRLNVMVVFQRGTSCVDREVSMFVCVRVCVRET